MSTMTFNDALGWAAAVCAVKSAVGHLLQTRSRLMTGDMKTGRLTAWPEDSIIPEPVIAVFKLGLLTSVGSPVPIDRLGGMAQNNSQNEPYFLVLAGALSLAGAAPANGVDLIRTYVYARLAHNAVFLYGPLEVGGVVIPVRALAYSASLVATVLLAKGVLM